MKIIINIIGWLAMLMSIIVIMGIKEQNIRNKGLLYVSIIYLLSGFLSVFFTSWIPLIAAFILSFLVKKIFGDPS